MPRKLIAASVTTSSVTAEARGNHNNDYLLLIVFRAVRCDPRRFP
jgi:hypothetical protein